MSKFLTSKIYLQSFLLFLLIAWSQCITAQDKKPKVALVLSGGGAKGIAHIPVLQALDSLGIVPDLIVGNSMGSIVGGLYAMGYSGDSIANIAKNANWDKLMGGGISLKDVSVEEKSEFNRYLIEVDWVKGNIKLGAYLLNDQNLREFISFLTYPSYKENDFDNLSIPFRAMATDIVNGKEVILNSGSLAYAMRASMSIPGIFSAVPYEETLLVDGGILNNFPVDVAKEMGAEIIIGSDVGSGLKTKENLENITSLLFQAGMLSSNVKNPSNRKLSDILIDHTANLTYTTGDFAKSAEIYKEGKIAVSQNMYALVALAKRLKKFGQRTHQLPYVKDEFVLDTVVYKNISKTNLALVKARTNIRANKTYNRQDIVDGINRAMGTTIFSQIIFSSLINGDKLGLQLNGFERSKHQVKGALHFDSYHGVGLFVNYTGRNIIGGASRSLITLDIAEQPRFRLQHQKNFGGDRDWWWRTEALGQQLKQKVFVGGENVDNMRYRYFEFDNQINRNLSSLRSYVGIGIKYKNTHVKPTIDPNLNNNIFGLKSYDFNTIELNTHYLYNSLNNPFYATNGSLLQADLTRSIHNNIDMAFTDETTPKVDGSINGYTKLALGYEKRFVLNKRVTGIIGSGAAFIFEDDPEDNDVSFSDFGMGAKYFFGGNQLDPRSDSYIFPGLNEGELTASQFMKLNLAVQINYKKNLYLTPHIDMASVGFKGFDDYIKKAFNPTGKWEDSNVPGFLMSTGATLSYNSILGPVDFDLSWVNGTNKIRFFIGVGFPLNRSN
ncbi:patatin-like phospholipase family protein [Mariniflexile sp.]|uniref:patatin-like phospholipase family protein n=1 Tax=Mariniflexile sp. TaxID=1979402 RepID=UPI004047A95E